ncbi:large ribosomal subunit protein mL46 [Neosynchiropus ocellatus]
MALPCGRTACRLLLRSWSRYGAAASRLSAARQWSRGSLHQCHSQTKTLSEKRSPWSLGAAVCLQRLPVISADGRAIEQEFEALVQQMELEKSLLSDHELQLLEDAERLRRKQSDNYDPEEDDRLKDQDIVLTQDLEDLWEQKMKSFEPAPRVQASVDEDPTSPRRCLAESLVLLTEQQVDGEKAWLLPQTRWREGETLRQTAERALAVLPDADLKTTFLGNAPCGVYKSKLPRALRTDTSVGVKVFFFKAFLSDGGAAVTSDPSRVWLRKAELERFLRPDYQAKVDRFLLDL